MYKHLLLIIFFSVTLSGAKAQENYYFVFLNTNPDRETISKDSIATLQEKHLANIGHLYALGKLVAAGPFDSGGGIFILKAPSLDSAKNMLHTDPAIAAERFKIEVYDFQFHTGSICPAPEPFEMTTYQFIRYYKGVAPLHTEKFDEIYARHLQYFSSYKDSMVAEGRFSPQDGFIQVINIQDTSKLNHILEQDILVRQNYYYTEIKRLWIAKGTFCEK